MVLILPDLIQAKQKSADHKWCSENHQLLNSVKTGCDPEK